MLPSEPNLLLSIVNTKLRDKYTSLSELCDDLDEDEYYMEDLISCKVYTLSNEYIGEVVDLLILPTQEVLEIKKENSKIVMVPYVDAFIKEIDVENKKIYIDTIEGLVW